MGRGRAKAKQTKIARELKYSDFGTDLDRLRAEISGDLPGLPSTTSSVSDDDEDDDLDELDVDAG